VRKGIDARRKALRRLGETRVRHACTAPNVVITLVPSKLS
jgi:hypothetical protein